MGQLLLRPRGREAGWRVSRAAHSSVGQRRSGMLYPAVSEMKGVRGGGG